MCSGAPKTPVASKSDLVMPESLGLSPEVVKDLAVGVNDTIADEVDLLKPEEKKVIEEPVVATSSSSETITSTPNPTTDTIATGAVEEGLIQEYFIPPSRSPQGSSGDEDNENEEEEDDEEKETSPYSQIPLIISHLDGPNLRIAKKDCLNGESEHGQMLTHSIDSMLYMIEKTVSRDERYSYFPQGFQNALLNIADKIVALGQVSLVAELLCQYENVAAGVEVPLDADDEKVFGIFVPTKTMNKDEELAILKDLVSVESEFVSKIKKHSGEKTKELVEAVTQLRAATAGKISMDGIKYGGMMKRLVAWILRLNDVSVKIETWCMFQNMEEHIEKYGEESMLKDVRDHIDPGVGYQPTEEERSAEDAKYHIAGKWVPRLHREARPIRAPRFHIGDHVVSRCLWSPKGTRKRSKMIL